MTGVESALTKVLTKDGLSGVSKSRASTPRQESPLSLVSITYTHRPLSPADAYGRFTWYFLFQSRLPQCLLTVQVASFPFKDSGQTCSSRSTGIVYVSSFQVPGAVAASETLREVAAQLPQGPIKWTTSAEKLVGELVAPPPDKWAKNVEDVCMGIAERLRVLYGIGPSTDVRVLRVAHFGIWVTAEQDNQSQQREQFEACCQSQQNRRTSHPILFPSISRRILRCFRWTRARSREAQTKRQQQLSQCLY
eukprot:284818920_4